MVGVSDFFVAAADVGDELRGELAELLSRAYTDSRHVAGYSADELLKWGPYLEAVVEHLDEHGPVMPREWLGRFPTMRNLWREPDRRVDSGHFIERAGKHVAGHVAMFPHDFRLGGEGPIRAAFIEDVATDPMELGAGIASRLLRRARDHATLSGAAIMGLSTNIPAFYERLGWQRWAGPAAYRSRSGELLSDGGTMVLPLCDEAAVLVGRHQRGTLEGGLRDGS